LADGRLDGGNTGGAVRIGATVRRAAGPWAPAVHAPLGPRGKGVRLGGASAGADEQGREVLTYRLGVTG
jgi:hypothetical protein